MISNRARGKYSVGSKAGSYRFRLTVTHTDADDNDLDVAYYTMKIKRMYTHGSAASITNSHLCDVHFIGDTIVIYMSVSACVLECLRVNSPHSVVNWRRFVITCYSHRMITHIQYINRQTII